MDIRDLDILKTIPDPFEKTPKIILDEIILNECKRLQVAIDTDPNLVKSSIRDNVNFIALYSSIADCESAYGNNRTPRYEPSYAGGGAYYKRSPVVRKLWTKYQAAAACSYSSFQILYVVAYELGFSLSPIHLSYDVFAIKKVTDLLTIRIFPKCRGTTELSIISQIADAYNSGSPNDNIRPETYISKFINKYKSYI